MRARSTLAAFLVAALALVFAPVVSAQGMVSSLPLVGPTAFTITDTTLLGFRASDYNPDNSHAWDFFFLTERLDFSAQAAQWRFYLRFDSFTPVNQDTSCRGSMVDECFIHSNYRQERVDLRYQHGDYTFEIGDYYQLFGRGIALAFRKVDPLGLDTALRGARFDIDHGPWVLRGFAGQANPQNLDPITLTVFPDPNDYLAGASAGVRLGPDQDIELSGHAVHTSFERLAAGPQDNVDVAGFRAEIPSLMDGDLNFYGEYDAMRRVSNLNNVNTQYPGHAFYAAAQLIHGPLSVLLEWKDYTHYLVAPTEDNNSSPQDLARQYSAAPSLERDDQRPFTNANVRGGRVRVDYSIPNAPWLLTLNSLWYGWADSYTVSGQQIDPWDPHQAIVATHTYVALRRRTRGGRAASSSNGPPGSTPGAPGPGGLSPGGAASGPVAVGSAGAVQRVGLGDYALYTSVGYRREFHAGSDPNGQWAAGDLYTESIQGEIEVAFPVTVNDSLDLRLDNWFVREYTFDPIPPAFSFSRLIAGGEGGIRGGVAISWAHGSKLVVSALFRWDNTLRGVGQASVGDIPFGQLSPLNPTQTIAPVLYPAGEVRWNFSTGNFVRFFGGMTPAGIVCSGGVCRTVPLFQGGLIEFVVRI